MKYGRPRQVRRPNRAGDSARPSKDAGGSCSISGCSQVAPLGAWASLGYACWVAIVLATGLGLTLVLAILLQVMNSQYARRHADRVPKGFESSIDQATLKKMSAYASDRARLALVSDTLIRLLVIAAVSCGWLAYYDAWTTGLSGSFVVQGTFYLLVLSWGMAFLSLPIELYEKFVVEARHGFNHSGARLFWLDFIKGRLVSTVVLGVIALIGLNIVRESGRYWWLSVWAFLFLFQVLITFIAPKVIEPLFVRMTPLSSEQLRDRILRLSAGVGVRVDRIMQVDASRRSGHTNAYFSGFGPVRRVVLYDTLLDRLTPDEVIAVLAHELGHWKHRHVLQRFLLSQGVLFGACAGAGVLVAWEGLPLLVGAVRGSFSLRVTAVVLIGAVVGFFTEPLLNLWSRKQEWQADAFAVKHVPRHHLRAALIKLAKDNLANLHVHPWYAAYHASHPTLPARVAQLSESTHAPEHQLEHAGTTS